MYGNSAGKKILIADDEQANLSILEGLLNALGYKVIKTTNGKVAVHTAIDIQPDLIILDIIMPVMDGFEACKILKSHEKTKHIPIIFITGLDASEHRIKGLSLGADDFLNKPIEFELLNARVRNLLKIKEYHDYLSHKKDILEEEVKQRTKEISEMFQKLQIESQRTKNAYLETIHRLSIAAEYKDEDTADHIKRISYYSRILGEKLGLPVKQLELLEYASPMHDIGKIGIPDKILLKPAPLTKKEWEIMKTHTIIGAKILAGSTSEFLQSAEIIALTHHERYDGKGYPRGIAKRKIPFFGRIVALVDVFDAMLSRRPYKKPISLIETLEYIKEQREKHFCPEVVDAFFAGLNKFVIKK